MIELVSRGLVLRVSKNMCASVLTRVCIEELFLESRRTESLR